ncbi:MAG: thiol reductant ABC exporter subunit CydC [Deinococcales bacterium]
MRAALRLLAGHPLRLAAAATLAAAMVLAGMGLLSTSGYLIGRAALHPDTVLALMVAVTGVRFFGLARAAVRYAERLVSHDLTLRVLASLRRHVYARLVPLAPLTLNRHRSADLLGRLVADVDELQTVYLKLVVPMLAAVLVTTVAVVLVALLSLPAAAVTLALLLAAGLALPGLLARIERPLGRREAALHARRRVLLLDTLQGAEELWVYGRSADYRSRLAALDAELGRLAARRAHLEGLRDGVGTLLGLAAPWAAVVAALPQVSSGALAPLLLVPLALGVGGAFEATAPLAEAFERWARSRSAAARIQQVLDQPPRVRDPQRPAPLPESAILRVSGVGFDYDGRHALEEVDVTVAPGRRVAVVGATGSGKTTLVRLLERFTDPTQGTVTLGGIDLRSLRQEDVRARLGVVPQHVTLFQASVRANLAIACPGAPDDALWEALSGAALDERIAALPDGLDTLLGEYGSRLSMGERQRLAIARALLKGAPLLLLDEPTAHLDTVTERRVLHALLAPRVDRGVLLVTHRLVGLEDVDEIVVLEDGRVTQRGRHHVLASEPGPYRRLLQAPWTRLEDEAPTSPLPGVRSS